jgi:UDP-N-acetylmuramoylalanine--D-glutamate ligase
MTAITAKTTAGGLTQNRELGSICVLGLGVTGKAVVEYCLKQGGRVSSLAVYDQSPNAETRAFVQGLPPDVKVVLDGAEVTGQYDTVIVSPGIAPATPIYQSALAHCQEIISEPEFAWRERPFKWVGITGTNGKTTTTTLLAHLLNSAGCKAFKVGNIGVPCIKAICEAQDSDWLVAELSSYQLHGTKWMALDAAILLNITPDHLNWHGTHEAYSADKLKVFANMSADALRVIDAVEEPTRAVLRQNCNAGNKVVPLGTADGLTGDMTKRCKAANAAFVDGEQQVLTVIIDGERFELISARELALKGAHNIENALAACAVALSIGVLPEALCAGLRKAAPLEHRFEPVGKVGGVFYINDSKATNTASTIKALESLAGSSTIILLGGSDKGTDLEDFAKLVANTTHTAICYGEAGPRFAKALRNRAAQGEQLAIFEANGLADAFILAKAMAREGDTVLLSPANASFDEFDSYIHRGMFFKSLVEGSR